MLNRQSPTANRQQPLFDTHAHLYFPTFKDPAGEVARCREAGVDLQVQIGCDEISSLAALALAKAHEGVYCTIGLHPCDVGGIGKRSEYQRYQGFEDYQLQCHNLKELMAFLGQTFEADNNAEYIVGFGETGFDLYHENTPELFAAQYESFLAHLELCATYDRPIVIHNRNTQKEFLDFWRKNLDIRGGKSFFNHTRIRGVFHCFSEDADYARILTGEFGLMIGIGGIATYPKAEKVREAIKATPLECLLSETDSPFLPPQSRKEEGIKQNSPAYLGEVVGLIAQVKEMDPDEVIAQVYQNGKELFGV